MLFRAEPYAARTSRRWTSRSFSTPSTSSTPRTFTARVIVSTLSDLHSGITGAIGALKGPLHGGANEKVMDVLSEVGNTENAETWIRDALARKEKDHGLWPPRLQRRRSAGRVPQRTLQRARAEKPATKTWKTMADIIERDHLGREEAAAEPRLALRPALPLHGPAGRTVHAAVCGQPRRRLESPTSSSNSTTTASSAPAPATSAPSAAPGNRSAYANPQLHR